MGNETVEYKICHVCKGKFIVSMNYPKQGTIILGKKYVHCPNCGTVNLISK